MSQCNKTRLTAFTDNGATRSTFDTSCIRIVTLAVIEAFPTRFVAMIWYS